MIFIKFSAIDCHEKVKKNRFSIYCRIGLCMVQSQKCKIPCKVLPPITKLFCISGVFLKTPV